MAHHPILDSLQPIIKNARFVTINDEALNMVVDAGFKPAPASDIGVDDLPHNLDEDGRIGFILILDALNFFFWGEPKWTIMRNGEALGGSHGLAYALKLAVESRALIVEPQALQALTKNDLANVLSANIEIPFLTERLNLLHALGRIMTEQGRENWKSIFNKTKRDALDVAQTLVETFPTIFKDEVMHEDQSVRFWKRAQLAANHLASLLQLETSTLTALADYKIPSVLRNLDVLEYNDDLAHRIYTKTELPAGSQEELEIRAHMIIAIDRLTRQYAAEVPGIKAIQVNEMLWWMGRKKSPTDKPPHRTKTIWY